MLNNLLLDSWRFFANHLRVIVIIVLPIVVPIEVFAAVYEYYFLGDQPTMQQLLMLRIPSIIASPIYSVAVVFYIASVVYNKPLGLGALWQLGVKFWFAYFTLSLLIGILAGFGLLMFILPGIFLLAKFAFAPFDLLLNGSNPIDAIKHSWQQTTGHTATILGGYAVIAVMLLGGYLILATIISAAYGDYATMQEQKSAFLTVYNLLLSLAFSILEFFFTIFAFRVYDYAKTQQGTHTP